MKPDNLNYSTSLLSTQLLKVNGEIERLIESGSDAKELAKLRTEKKTLISSIYELNKLRYISKKVNKELEINL